jgi:hypothetical protein
MLRISGQKPANWLCFLLGLKTKIDKFTLSAYYQNAYAKLPILTLALFCTFLHAVRIPIPSIVEGMHHVERDELALFFQPRILRSTPNSARRTPNEKIGFVFSDCNPLSQ